MDLIIAEKHNAAQRIASALGEAKQVKKGPVKCYELKGKAVVPLRGHIKNPDFPDKYSSWNRTDLNELVNAPIQYKQTRKTISNAIKHYAKKADELKIATDFDREGESIGKEAIEIAREKNKEIPIKRARFSSLTKEDVSKAFDSLNEFDWNLADSADARREIDLIWGAVLTRYLSLTANRLGKSYLSAGRVQTPTLSIMVDREKHRQDFDPEPYWKPWIKCSKNGENFKAKYKKKKVFDKEKAQELKELKGDEARVKNVKTSKYTRKPPKPFNTTSFLRQASSIGFSPSSALSIAESLYQDGLISYPRTDNTQYPDSLDIKQVLGQVKQIDRYTDYVEKLLAKGKLSPTKGKKKSTDHPPIHPVKKPNKKLNKSEWKIYKLIADRFLATLSEKSLIQSVKTKLNFQNHEYHARGRRILKPGWQQIYPYKKTKEKHVPKLEEGENVKVKEADADKKKTKPKPRYSSNKIIKKMEDENLGTKCLTEGTLVKIKGEETTSKTMKDLFESSEHLGKIDEEIEVALNLNTEIYSADHKDIEENAPYLVTRRQLKPEESMLKIHFKDGSSVEATESHPFYALEEGKLTYKKSSSLTQGTRVVSSTKHPHTETSKSFTWEEFLGEVDKSTRLFAIDGIKYLEERIEGMAQHEAAEELNSHQGDISNYLNGKNKVPLWLFKKMDSRPDLVCGMHKQTVIENPFPLRFTPSLARLLGCLAGDGSIDFGKLKKENCLDFRYHNTNLDLLHRFASDIEEVFGIKLRVRERKTTENRKAYYYIQVPAVIGKILYTIFPELLEKNPSERIPIKMYPYFIGALFDDEGHTSKDEAKLFISNTNHKLLSTVEKQLSELGIYSKLNKEQHKLHIRGKENITSFLQEIPIASTDKKQRLIRHLTDKYRYGRSTSTPLQERQILKMAQEKPRTTKEIADELDIVESGARRHINRLKDRELLEKIVIGNNKDTPRKIKYKATKPLYNTFYSLIGEKVISEDLSTKTVEKVEEIDYDKSVYDITCIDKPPNFVLANNIVVHNSTRPGILDKLVSRRYVTKNKKYKPLGVAFAVINSLEDYAEEITKPEMTAKIEEEMEQIQEGKKSKKEVVKDSRKMLSEVLEVLQDNKKEVGEEIKEALQETEKLGKCSECGGNLVIRRSRSGSRFVGCSGYPKCKNTYPLPQKGHVEATGEKCEECNAPMVKITRSKGKNYEMCLNPDCKSKEDW